MNEPRHVHRDVLGGSRRVILGEVAEERVERVRARLCVGSAHLLAVPPVLRNTYSPLDSKGLTEVNYVLHTVSYWLETVSS